jgi:hypothetical protein
MAMMQCKLGRIVLFMVLSACYTEANAVELTIYSSAAPGTLSSNNPNVNEILPGYAYVIDRRELTLQLGQNEIHYTHIPSYIDPTTVQFRSLTDVGGTEILQQKYRFDLLNNQTLLESYLGKEITVEQGHGSDLGSFTGTLLNTQNGLTLQDKNKQIVTVSNYSAIRLPLIENEEFKQPTLIWNIVAKKQGLHQTETRYQTKGITWWADYNALFEEKKDPNSGTLELNSWVTVMNKTGLNFDNADLKLVAGDVNTAQTPQQLPRANLMMAAKVGYSGSAGFTEKPFFEYHVYALNGKISLANNATQQIKFLPKFSKIPVEKLYIYDSNPGMLYTGYNNTERYVNTNMPAKVDVYLKWKNTNRVGLGMPLPAGRVRISAISKSNKTPEFIGEDIIDHTARDEEIQIKMGSAFDVSVEKKQTDFSLDENRHIMEESFEIGFKNHKDHDVKVFIQENFYRTANWEILKNSNPFEKINSGTVKFPLVVKAGSDAKVQYTVRYTW